jgi:hypothetical protein
MAAYAFSDESYCNWFQLMTIPGDTPMRVQTKERCLIIIKDTVWEENQAEAKGSAVREKS